MEKPGQLRKSIRKPSDTPVDIFLHLSVLHHSIIPNMYVPSLLMNRLKNIMVVM